MRSRRLFSLILCFVLLLVASLPAGAQSPADEGPSIYLNRVTFDPLRQAPAVDTPLTGLLAPAGGQIVLLQFDGPVQDEWKAAAEQAGLELLSYVPDFAFVVRLKGASLAATRALPHVRWAGDFLPIYKLEASLDARAADPAPLTATISLHPGADRAAVEAAVIAAGGSIEERAEGVVVGDALRVVIPGTALNVLARLEDVAWIEPRLPDQLFNDRARVIMGVNNAWTTMAGRGINLYGSGQIVDVADTGLDTGNLSTINLDFRGRVVKTYTWGRPGDWSDPDSHGTHVAGSVLGNGTNSGSNPATHNYANSFAGAAPEASLIFQSLLTAGGGLSAPTDLKQLFGPAHTDGARVHSNSWGHPTGGTSSNPTWGGYDNPSMYVDEFMWLNPTSLVLYSAANNGVDADANGVIDTDEIASPATAKNVLTVGAMENNRPPSAGFGGYSQDVWGTGSWLAKYPADPIRSDYISNNSSGMAAFSSRGPTDDGRIKPEIAAPGTDIISVRSHAAGAGTGWGVYNSNYIYDGGTSMSTPLTAGAAAITRQFYVQAKGVANPSGALVKATLINGAQNTTPGQYGTGAYREIPASTPNIVFGWGRVNMTDTLALRPNYDIKWWDVTQGLNTQGSATYNVQVTQAGPAGSVFKATLCWTDYPGTAYAGKELVNDLDLEVVAPGGTSYKGNGGASWDRLNNTEQVVIANPPAGTYQIIVRGFNVAHGPQPYAVVVTSPYISGQIPGQRHAYLPLVIKKHNPAATPTPTVTPSVTPTPTATPTSPSGPQPGFWSGASGAVEFTVPADRAHVNNFAIYVNVIGCGSYKITHVTSEPIVSNSFGFSGAFYASGTFTSATAENGVTGLSSFYIADCGYVSSEQPWSYSTTWQHAAPPAPSPLEIEPLSSLPAGRAALPATVSGR